MDFSYIVHYDTVKFYSYKIPKKQVTDESKLILATTYTNVYTKYNAIVIWFPLRPFYLAQWNVILKEKSLSIGLNVFSIHTENNDVTLNDI